MDYIQLLYSIACCRGIRMEFLTQNIYKNHKIKDHVIILWTDEMYGTLGLKHSADSNKSKFRSFFLISILTNAKISFKIWSNSMKLLQISHSEALWNGLAISCKNIGRSYFSLYKVFRQILSVSNPNLAFLHFSEKV